MLKLPDNKIAAELQPRVDRCHYKIYFPSIYKFNTCWLQIVTKFAFKKLLLDFLILKKVCLPFRTLKQFFTR